MNRFSPADARQGQHMVQSQVPVVRAPPPAAAPKPKIIVQPPQQDQEQSSVPTRPTNIDETDDSIDDANFREPGGSARIQA